MLAGPGNETTKSTGEAMSLLGLHVLLHVQDVEGYLYITRTSLFKVGALVGATYFETIDYCAEMGISVLP